MLKTYSEVNSGCEACSICASFFFFFFFEIIWCCIVQDNPRVQLTKAMAY